MNNKRIFTFWEPHDKMPGYLQLCIETWKKFLPDYEIVICDYENITEYISEQSYKKVQCRDLSMPKQVDMLRCALLYENGGIWLDADTVVTSGRAREILECPESRDSEMVVLGLPEDKELHFYGSLFIVSKPHATLISKWFELLPERIATWKRYKYFMQFFNRSEWRKIWVWNYCMNAILQPMFKKASPAEYCMLDANKYHYLPHRERMSVSQETDFESYIRYWFTGEGDTCSVI